MCFWGAGVPIPGREILLRLRLLLHSLPDCFIGDTVRNKCFRKYFMTKKPGESADCRNTRLSVFRMVGLALFGCLHKSESNADLVVVLKEFCHRSDGFGICFGGDFLNYTQQFFDINGN